jgi:hypothetical protein
MNSTEFKQSSYFRVLDFEKIRELNHRENT